MIHYISEINGIPLKKNIEIIIEHEHDEYLLTIDELNLYSYSEDLNEAIDDIKLDLNELYNILFEGKYELGKPMISLKNKFKKYI